MKLHLPSGLILMTDKALEAYLIRKGVLSQKRLTDALLSSSLEWGCRYEGEHFRPHPEGDRTINLVPMWARKRALTKKLFGFLAQPVQVMELDPVAGNNIIPTEGRNHILDTELHATSQVTTWYIAPFEANYTPVAGDTAATFPASATESTAYAEATRVAFVEAAASAGSTSNTANKAEFSINATKTMYGAFMTSVSTKSATTGTLLSAALFAASRAVISGDLLRITSTISLTSS